MDQKIPLISLPFFILLLFQCTKTLAQPPDTAPSGPTNITKILEKQGQFTTFIRLLQVTLLGDQIDTQLIHSNQGLTVFAPTDNAFSSLKPGTLNTLTNQDQVALVQYHVLPTFLSMSQFQTVSNPLRTQAGDTFPLNVTTSGNQVNISTGVDDATLGNTVYTDNQLAVYQVDKVLLPLRIFGPPSPAPAPAPAPVVGVTEKKKPTGSPSAVATDSPADSSGASGDAVHGAVAFGAALFGIFYLSPIVR